jgi:hypothetical protein
MISIELFLILIFIAVISICLLYNSKLIKRGGNDYTIVDDTQKNMDMYYEKKRKYETQLHEYNLKKMN